VVLTAIAILTKLLNPYIVAPSNKRLLNAGSTFLQSAVHQHVAWYPVSERAFQEARRLDRPILLVVGAPWSLTGRQMDAAVFNSVIVQKLLAREFICIRADTVETPDWMSAYLPIARANLGMQSDFQIWMLDSEARLFRQVDQHAADATPNETQFNGELATDLADLQLARDAEFSMQPTVSLPGVIQTDDLARLFATTQNLSPVLPAYRQSLLDITSASRSGGFPVGGHQRLWPNAWSFLLATAGPDVTSASVDGLLKSPCVDLLDGGFFNGSTDANWRAPDYDKVARLNAELCQLMAQLATSNPSGPYAYFARTTFNSLAGEFLDSEGLIRPCRIGDEQGHYNRSTRSSFSPRQMRAALGPSDRLWAYKALNLPPTVDSVVTPFVTDFGVLSNPQFDSVMKHLRSAEAPIQFDHEVTLATFGPCVARMVAAARLLKNPQMLQQAGDILARMELFRQGTDVVHELTPSERAKPVLDDYLGYADAALEDFLASGRVASLQNGAHVLQRGLKLYAVPGQTCFRTSLADSIHRLAPDSNSPQICDDAGESSNAKAIRLGWTYSLLLAGSNSHIDRVLAAELRAKATACVTQFADVAAAMGPYSAGYANAAALVTDNTVILCAGLDPAKMANEMVPFSPLRVVAPVVGPVYPSLFKKPGYYVCRHGQMVGPMTADQVTNLLPATLFING
jgi:hypothetical protein